MLKFYTTKWFRHFLPFMILIVGGSFLVREFTDVRYKYRAVTSYNIKKDMKEAGIEMRKSSTLEEEYENVMNQLDINNWENVRISRPYEETNNTKS